MNEEFGGSSLACRSDESALAEGEPRLDISSEQGREIGIDHGGVAAPDEFHQRAHLMAHRDLREAHFVGEARCLALMVWMRISMHEHDGDGVDALGARGVERGARGGKVERRLHAAVGAQALRHLGDACIEHRRLLYSAREDLWPRLIADLERVAEPFAHQQQDAIALALEQRIGGDRGAHLDAVDQLGRERDGRAASPSRSPMPAVAASRIGLGILREELVGQQPAVRRPRHDVGEGAAAVDAELPGAQRHPSRISPAAYCFQRRT